MFEILERGLYHEKNGIYEFLLEFKGLVNP